MPCLECTSGSADCQRSRGGQGAPPRQYVVIFVAEPYIMRVWIECGRRRYHSSGRQGFERRPWRRRCGALVYFVARAAAPRSRTGPPCAGLIKNACHRGLLQAASVSEAGGRPHTCACTEPPTRPPSLLCLVSEQRLMAELAASSCMGARFHKEARPRCVAVGESPYSPHVYYRHDCRPRRQG